MRTTIQLVLGLCVAGSLFGCDTDEKKMERVRPICDRLIQDEGAKGWTADDCAKETVKLEKECTNFSEISVCLVQAKAGKGTEADCRSKCQKK